MHKRKILGITGYAQSGKDTLFALLDRKFPHQFERFAFADQLKMDIGPFLKEKTGLDIYQLNVKEKNLIRPLLVAYGCLQRNLSKDGLYWVEKLEDNLNRNLYWCNTNIIPIITDVRFPNEAIFFKNREIYDFRLIKVVKTIDGFPIAAPNDEEFRNQPLVDPYVDLTITWPHVDGQIEKLEKYIKDIKLFNNHDF